MDGYLIATLMVLPLLVYGMKALTRLQVWTTPLWLVLMVVPVVWLIVKDPQLVDGFLHFAGKNSASTVDITAIMLGAGVCLSLIMQIGEQIDYLRFMPPKTAENRKNWWAGGLFRRPGLGGVRRDQTDHRRLPRLLSVDPFPGGAQYRTGAAVRQRLR